MKQKKPVVIASILFFVLVASMLIWHNVIQNRRRVDAWSKNVWGTGIDHITAAHEELEILRLFNDGKPNEAVAKLKDDIGEHIAWGECKLRIADTLVGVPYRESISVKTAKNDYRELVGGKLKEITDDGSGQRIVHSFDWTIPTILILATLTVGIALLRAVHVRIQATVKPESGGGSAENK